MDFKIAKLCSIKRRINQTNAMLRKRLAAFTAIKPQSYESVAKNIYNLPEGAWNVEQLFNQEQKAPSRIKVFIKLFLKLA